MTRVGTGVSGNLTPAAKQKIEDLQRVRRWRSSVLRYYRARMKGKKLYRSTESSLVAGVLGGLAEYFEHDPLVWRLGFVVCLILTGLFPGVIIYLLFWVVGPLQPTVEPVAESDYTVLS